MPIGALETEFCLEDWIVRPQRNSIRRGDEVVHLAPKAMAVLQCLAEAGGEVVSREDLFNAVWPGAIISDDALTQRIVELRKAFGDTAQQPRFIKTIPKVGFRLIPPVTPVHKQNAGRWRVLTTALIVLALAFIVTNRDWLELISEPEPEVAISTQADAEKPPLRNQPNPKSIAVLPFANMSGAEENRYLSEGIADTILNMLAQNPDLLVISRTSSFKPQLEDLDIRGIAEQLGVATILEGSLQRQGDQLRITAQLIDVESDSHLWSKNFDRDDTNIFAIQDEIALAVTSALNVVVRDDVKQRIELKGTDNSEAYDEYMFAKGLEEAGKPEEAMAHYERAIELDPEYALAHVAIAYLYWDVETLPEMSMVLKQHKAQQAANHAIEVAPDIPEALVLLAQLTDDHVIKGQLLKRAYENEPNNVQAILPYAAHLGWNANPALSEALAQKALRLDPLTEGTYWNLWIVRLATERWDEALEIIKLWKEKFPRSTWAMSIDALHHAFQGEYYTVMSKYIEAIKLDPDNWFFRWNVGMLYLNVHMPEQAQRWFSSIEAAPRLQNWIDLSSHSSTDIYYQRNDEAIYANAKKLLQDGAGFPFGSHRDIVDYGARLGLLDEVLSVLEERYPQVFSEPPPSTLRPSEVDTYYPIALALLLQGDIERGEPLMRACLDAEDKYYASYKLVRLRAIDGRLALGEREAALEKFRRFAELKWIWNGGNFAVVRKFQHSSLYDPIRDEPEFIALINLYEKNAAEQRRLIEEADFQIP